MTSGSHSGSDSESRSSSEVLIAHFEEAAGYLAEQGYAVDDWVWQSIVLCIQEENLGSLEFWATDGKDNGKAMFALDFDWDVHHAVVRAGDRLPVRLRDDKTIEIQQVQRATFGLIRTLNALKCQFELRMHYSPAAQHIRDELDRRYGWTPASSIKMPGSAQWSVGSRTHAGVTLRHRHFSSS